MERSINHQHPTHEYSRHGLRIARDMGADLSAALWKAYPDRGFVVEYWEEMISFYQRGGGAPEQDDPPTETLSDTTWCETCRTRKPYRANTTPDAEFPLAEWGVCAECEAELLIRTWHVRETV